MNLTQGYFDYKSLKNVLDAGCGPAGVNMILSQEVVAIDPLLTSYKSFEHFKPSNHPQVDFIQCKLEEFESSKKFELVCCLNVINHVEDIKGALLNLFQNTANGGWLLLSIDAHNYKLLKHLFRLIPGDALHPHQCSLLDYKSMVEQVGYVLQGDHLVKHEFIFDYHLLIAKKP